MFLLDMITYCYESITPFVIAAVLAALLLYLILGDMSVPPGPRGLPVLGYYPFLKTEACHLQLQELSRKYGDVFSFRVAGTLIISLGSIKAIREAHITKSDCFQERYQDSLLYRAFGHGGVAFAHMEPWKILRKFYLNMLKEYGVNTMKEDTDSTVYDALKKFVEELKSSKGRPFQLNDLFTRQYTVVLQRMMFSNQGMSVEEMVAVNDEYREMMKEITSTNLLLIGKFAKYCMFPFMSSVKRFDKHSKRIDAILSEVLRRHKPQQNESQNPDLVDCFFQEKEKRRLKGDPSAKYFTDRSLMNTLNMLVADGVQTVCVLVANYLITLVQRPEEQEKIYEEICEVIGTDRLPTLEDKNKLQYTNAFLLEVQRYGDFFPLFPSLQCTKETTIQGYKIPKGSVTLLNFYSAHRNPTYYENPEEFNPARYLPSPDKQRPDLPILFGIGKRSCIGEGFSQIQSFLFFTTLVQNFRLSYPEDSVKQSNMFWEQEQLKLCAHPRQHIIHQQKST